MRTYLQQNSWISQRTHALSWKWTGNRLDSLQVSNEALDPSKLEGLLGCVAVKLEASLQVSVTEVVHKGPDDGAHQVLFHHEHPGLQHACTHIQTDSR